MPGLFSTGGGHHWLKFCQFPEVLGGSCESKFVLDAAWSSQSESSQAEDTFEMGEEHFDLLSSFLGCRIEL